ncbi:MAG: hypothetical protein KDB14_28880 [Planctomycetales bacterium]|nr:hypothetical protein [Planctomycetales bacterium]
MKDASRISLARQDAQEVLLSVNPKAGARSGHDLVTALQSQLEKLGFRTRVITSPDELRQAAEDGLANETLRTVVCCGGDGTIAFVANATPPATPLSILPLGTENLFSKYLGIKPNAEQVAQTIAEGWMCRFDAGLATPLAATPGDDVKATPGRIFTLMAGVGFDAEVVRQVHENRTGHIHHLTYAKPIWQTIRNYRYPELRVVPIDGEDTVVESGGSLLDLEGLRAKWVFVANLPRYAGNLQIVPDADGLDGLLDVCTFKHGSLWRGVQYLGAVLLRRHRQWSSEVRTFRAAKLRIETVKNTPVSYQLDGDYGGQLPLEIEVLRERLTMLCPRDWLEQHQLELPSLSAPPS